MVIALSAEAKLESQATIDEADATRIAAGQELLKDTEKCAMCHKFHDVDEGGGAAPDLTGYGSKEWLTAFISNPADPRFYGDRNDRMPAFGKGGPETRLSPETLNEIVDFLRSDWNQAVDSH